MEKARAMIHKGADYLRAHQDAASGGWSISKATAEAAPSPQFPAITGLVLTALLMDDRPIAANRHAEVAGPPAADPAVAAAVKYLLNFQKPDGGIYDQILPSYNTSISLSALALVDHPDAKAAIPHAQRFLRALQWSEDADNAIGGAEAPRPVDPQHVFYGGVGYGKHGRPDNSNLNMMLQAMHDSGVSPDDACVRRALKFLERTQMLDSVNDMAYADGSRQGGFIYATVPNAASASVGGDPRAAEGQSFAGVIDETLDNGDKVSRLRCYGSMTYAGFKSYLYADLAHDDPRVAAAYDWIRRHYTLDENPGMGTDGLYYYFVTFARALDAYGPETISLPGPTADAPATEHTWSHDLIDHLAQMQNEDGAFRSVDDRWMENDPNLITAYALIALGHAIDADDRLNSHAK